MSFDQLIAEIQKLPLKQRVDLVDQILEGCGGKIDPEVERAQLDEVARRRQNPGILIPAEDVFREADDLLK